jgi:glycosyltransferase involved in cell wall biosynthesis
LNSANRQKICIVIPVHNEAENIKILAEKIVGVVSQINNYCFEILFVDDGSNDNTITEIEKLIAQNLPVGFIQLSRNYGHQSALEAGFASASIDAVAIITMDGDLQHPPEEIIRMVKEFDAGADVVQMQRKNLGKDLKGFLSISFYSFFSWVSNAPLVPNAADFRLVSNKVIEQIKNMPGKGKLLRAIVPAIGFNQVHLEYYQDERKFGKPSYSLFDSYELAIQTTFKFSRFPANFCLFTGIITFISGVIMFLLLSFNVIRDNGHLYLVPPFLMLAGIIFLIAGIICWYLYFILEQVRRDPSYIIKKTVLPPVNQE